MNAVLSGYFANLLNTLLMRRQKLLIPYLFSERPEVIDNLLFHFYQKSISESVKKLMLITSTDYSAEMELKIKEG